MDGECGDQRAGGQGGDEPPTMAGQRTAEQRSPTGEHQLPACGCREGSEDEHRLFPAVRIRSGGPAAEHQRREVDHGGGVQHRHSEQPQIGPRGAEGCPVGPDRRMPLAVSADCRGSTQNRQCDEHQRRGPAQGQCDGFDDMRERRTSDDHDQRIEAVGRRDTERGCGTDLQRRPGRQGHQVGPDRSDRHGDAEAGQEPRDQGGDHACGESGLHGWPGCCWPRTDRAAVKVGDRRAVIEFMDR